MDGKLLVLCDEMPGIYNNDHDDYKIRDSRFLAQVLRYPEDDTDRIFVSWDSIIPEDRGFIEACKYYARFTDKSNDPTIPLTRRGSVDSATGNIKDSIQEDSYYTTYQSNLKYLSALMQKGEDWQGEAMELAVQYILDVQKYSDFGEILYAKSVDEIMKIYSMPDFREISDKKSYSDGPEM